MLQSREHLFLFGDGPANSAHFLMQLFGASLANMYTQAAHEFEPACEAAHLESHLASLSPRFRLFEELHRISFRKGLGNSLLSVDWKLGKLEPSALAAYKKKIASSSSFKYSLIGLGLSRESLGHLEAAYLSPAISALTADDAAREEMSGAATFVAGESFLESNANEFHSAVTVSLKGYSSHKNWPAQLVLKSFLLGPSIEKQSLLPYFSGSHVLSQLAEKFNVKVDAVDFSYSDANLVGFAVSSDSESSLVESSKNILEGIRQSKGLFDVDSFGRAKAVAKASLLHAIDSRLGYSLEAARFGVDPYSSLSHLESVKFEDVQSLLDSLLKAPMSAVTLGPSLSEKSLLH